MSGSYSYSYSYSCSCSCSCRRPTIRPTMRPTMRPTIFLLTRILLLLYSNLHLCAFHTQNMALYPKEHPSGRHSAVDWSEPDLSKFPEFEKVMVNEVVLQAGDVMYLPTNWFHYIISLDINFQCNSRSGITRESAKTMHECGF